MRSFIKTSDIKITFHTLKRIRMRDSSKNN